MCTVVARMCYGVMDPQKHRVIVKMFGTWGWWMEGTVNKDWHP